MVSGHVEQGSPIKFLHTNKQYEVKEVGRFIPKMQAVESLQTGDTGYIIANIKSTARNQDRRYADRSAISRPKRRCPDFRKSIRWSSAAFIRSTPPISSGSRWRLGKLQLNDAAFVFTPESSVALGFGFRCGFLGLLHMEIIQERLRREYDMDIIATYPSVIYEVLKTNGETLLVDNPTHLPDPSVIAEIREPIVKAFLLTPNENIGDLMQFVSDKRGEVDHTETLDTRRVMLTCVLAAQRNPGRFQRQDEEHHPRLRLDGLRVRRLYRAAKLVKLDILVNTESVDAFSSIVHRDKAEARARMLAAKLKEVIPTQLYQVSIQGAIGGKIVARENVSAMRKDVTAKCYGGDITRKRKLLEKQKEGKKRMKSIGKVNIPQEAFIQVLRAG